MDTKNKNRHLMTVPNFALFVGFNSGFVNQISYN